MNIKNQSETFKIVIIYVLLGCAWIYGSDSLLSWFSQDSEILSKMSIFKGLFFIICTSLLLFYLIARLNNKIRESTHALKKSENHLQTLIQTIPDLVWLKDKDGVYLSCNLMFERFLGAKQSKIIGKTDYDFIDRELADLFRAHDRKVMNEGEPFYNEEWITFADDGHRALLEKVKIPMFDNTGSLIGVLGIGRDITERKQIEDELRESDEKFRLAFSSSPDINSISRMADGLYADVNEGFTRIMGFTREEVIGKTSLELKIWTDNTDRQLLLDKLKKNGYCENLESTFYRKDGTLITVLISANSILLKGVPHIISVTRDISERKRHEEELLKMEKLESLGILAGGIAHDFNNILTGIIGNISLAKIHIDDTHRAAKPLSAAENAAMRAAELAQQLLTFARGGEPIKKIISPRTIIDETLSFVLRGSNIKAVVDIPDSIYDFEADEGQLSQVLQNLIINAIQAMPKGGTLSVKARNETLTAKNPMSLKPGKYLRIEIADQGHGIPPGEIRKIFDPYFTTKPAGNGLGLASSYSIVTRHGGHISASSVVAKGSVFTIFLPSVGTIFPRQDLIEQRPKPNRREGESVLVMDDEAMVREIAASMLDHLGYKVMTCTTGQEALDLYKKAANSGEPFSLVLMDLTIPGGFGGKQAAKKIKAEFPDARLIVSSGYSNDPIIANYMEFGFIRAISKPYSLDKLSKIIHSID